MHTHQLAPSLSQASVALHLRKILSHHHVTRQVRPRLSRQPIEVTSPPGMTHLILGLPKHHLAVALQSMLSPLHLPISSSPFLVHPRVPSRQELVQPLRLLPRVHRKVLLALPPPQPGIHKQARQSLTRRQRAMLMPHHNLLGLPPHRKLLCSMGYRHTSRQLLLRRLPIAMLQLQPHSLRLRKGVCLLHAELHRLQVNLLLCHPLMLHHRPNRRLLPSLHRLQEVRHRAPHEPDPHQRGRRGQTLGQVRANRQRRRQSSIVSVDVPSLALLSLMHTSAW